MSTAHDFDKISLMRPQERIIYFLEISRHTVPELEKLCHLNYYTVRDHVKSLEKAGLIKYVGYKKNAKLWQAVEASKMGTNDSLPVVKTSRGADTKVNAILDLVGKESTMASREAATGLPRFVATLLMNTLKLRNGTPHKELGTSILRKEMEVNRDQLEYTLKLYNSILNADALWEENRMLAIPLDRDFDHNAVVAAYRHYYPEA